MIAVRFNLNRLLKPQIKGKLAIAFAGLSMLPVVVVGILGISSNVKSMREAALESLSHDLLTIKERLGSFFQGIEHNIDFLVSSSSFHRFVEASKNHNSQDLSTATAELVPELMAFAQRKEIFYQIKFIDEGGNELFGIEHRQEHYRLLAEEELNLTGTRF